MWKHEPFFARMVCCWMDVCTHVSRILGRYRAQHIPDVPGFYESRPPTQQPVGFPFHYRKTRKTRPREWQASPIFVVKFIATQPMMITIQIKTSTKNTGWSFIPCAAPMRWIGRRAEDTQTLWHSCWPTGTRGVPTKLSTGVRITATGRSSTTSWQMLRVGWVY